MRPDTFDEFFELCEAEHDRQCVDGADCDSRSRHIQWAYMPRAMAGEIDGLRAKIHRARVALAGEVAP